MMPAARRKTPLSATSWGCREGRRRAAGVSLPRTLSTADEPLTGANAGSGAVERGMLGSSTRLRRLPASAARPEIASKPSSGAAPNSTGPRVVCLES
jgi:hypothetical protein